MGFLFALFEIVDSTICINYILHLLKTSDGKELLGGRVKRQEIFATEIGGGSSSFQLKLANPVAKPKRESVKSHCNPA